MTLTKKKIIALSVILVLLIAAVVLAIVLRPRLVYQPTDYHSSDPTAYAVVGLKGFAVSLTIPAEHEGLPVKYIRAPFHNDFSDQPFLRELVVSEGIFISSNAFYGCKALKSVTLASNVSVGSLAFAHCTSLRSLKLSDGISLYSHAFASCESLADVSLDGSLHAIYSSTFNNTPFFEEQAVCENGIFYLYDCAISIDPHHDFKGEITFREDTRVIANGWLRNYGSENGTQASSVNVTVPASVQMIGSSSHHPTLAKVTFLGKPAYITQEAFKDCTALTEVNFTKGAAYIGKSAFEGCTALADVHFTEGPAYIGENAFKGCTALKELVIPDGTETIGNEAFADCSALFRIALPGTLHTVYFSALKNCTALKRIELGEGIQKVQGFLSGSRLGPLEYLNIPRSVTYLLLGRLEISAQNLHIEDPNGWAYHTGKSVDLLKELEESWKNDFYTTEWFKSIPEAE